MAGLNVQTPETPVVRATFTCVSLQAKTLLDVTLCRNGDARRWSIWRRMNTCTCTRQVVDSISLSGCPTEEDTLTQKREWEAEITAARADGWS